MDCSITSKINQIIKDDFDYFRLERTRRQVPKPFNSLGLGFSNSSNKIVCSSPSFLTKQKPENGQFRKIIIKKNVNKTLQQQQGHIYLEKPQKSTRRPTSSCQPKQFLFQLPSRKIVYQDSPNIQRAQEKKGYSLISKMPKPTLLLKKQLLHPSIKFTDFAIIKILGQGKYAQVLLAMHKQTGVLCAVKKISKSIVKSQKIQHQIAKQIRIQYSLKSAYVLDIYGFFSDEENFYLILQFAIQGSFFSKLKGKTRLQEKQISYLIKGLCEGLKHMHRMGYIHRDIKPENILIQFGTPKMSDFGWATDCIGGQMRKSYCGTPLYLSPQLVNRKPYNFSVDVWGVGLIAYQLLVGRTPFSIWSQQDLSQILWKNIQFPTYIDRSKEIQDFILKCLQKQVYLRLDIYQACRHRFLIQSNNCPLAYQYQILQLTNQLFSRF